MKQRILALLLAAGLCLGIIGACIPAALAADETGVEEAVEVLAGLGIVSGCSDGSYHPEDNLTRAQFCKLAVLAEGHGDKINAGAYRTLFSDVPGSNWAAPYVNLAYEEGLVSGYGDGTFRPDETATRAQVVTLLYRIAGEPAVDDSKALPFTDVNLESWYGSALRWAYQNGITTGVSADTFAPDDCVTREQLVSFLARYAKVTGAYEKVSEDLSSFSDRDRVSSYAVESMQWAVANGLILGTETGKLEPMATATRAQLAAVVARYCQSIH